jgi:hypothetical protein
MGILHAEGLMTGTTSCKAMVNCHSSVHPYPRRLPLRQLITALDTWFRCLVKLIYSHRATHGLDIGYQWHEIGVFAKWVNPKCCRILCVDALEVLRHDLKASLEKMSALDLKDPFCMHVPLIDEIVKLYDQSVWLVRDAVRKIEKVHFIHLDTPLCSKGNYCADESPFMIEQSRNRSKF